MLKNAALLGFAFTIALLAGCSDAPASGDRGELLFANYCAPCHGPAGHGNQTLGAPNITGLPEWYVSAQLHKFRIGIRGSHFDDIAGMRMRPMSLALNNDQDTALVSKWVAGLPTYNSPATFTDGKVTSGKLRYAACAACHGTKGEGNQALGAPPMTQGSDWYLATQLHNFKVGIRGANPKDTTGLTMAPMAKLLTDDQAVHDVLAYIKSLAPANQ